MVFGENFLIHLAYSWSLSHIFYNHGYIPTLRKVDINSKGRLGAQKQKVFKESMKLLFKPEFPGW